MKASRKYVLSMLFATIAGAAHVAAWAHPTLQGSTPAKDAELTRTPKEVTLQFNEKLEAAFSNIKVLDEAGKTVSTDKATLAAADPSVMKVAVPPLAPGKYIVQFTAVGQDGHRRKGDYSFAVK
jgi:methionine-rich copper-binding protein CopC